MLMASVFDTGPEEIWNCPGALEFRCSQRWDRLAQTDDPGVRLFCADGADLSQIVIFPVTRHQQHGIEDLRMVRFVDDDGNASYLGTYTAFSGQAIRQELSHPGAKPELEGMPRIVLCFPYGF